MLTRYCELPGKPRAEEIDLLILVREVRDPPGSGFGRHAVGLSRPDGPDQRRVSRIIADPEAGLYSGREVCCRPSFR